MYRSALRCVRWAYTLSLSPKMQRLLLLLLLMVLFYYYAFFFCLSLALVLLHFVFVLCVLSCSSRIIHCVPSSNGSSSRRVYSTSSMSTINIWLHHEEEKKSVRAETTMATRERASVEHGNRSTGDEPAQMHIRAVSVSVFVCVFKMRHQHQKTTPTTITYTHK